MKDSQQLIIEQYIQAYNHFDIAGMCEHLHQEVVFQNIADGKIDLTTEGMAAFQAQAEKAKSFFTSRKQIATSWDFQGNEVTVGIDYEGILAIDLPNGLKVGEYLQLEGKSVFSFQENQIIKIQDIS